MSDADLLYQDEVRGSLLEQVDKSLELIYFKYLRAHISYEGVQRKERYPFPLEALREALLNAVVHKDYSKGVPIQVSIYDDKIYIANVGRLPATWTVENLLAKHTSVPFNPNVAHALYLAGYIESWGRGVEKIFNACADDSVPEPKYMVHPEDIMIQFTAPEERVIKTVIEKLSDKLSDKELQILELLIEDPAYTSREMAKKLGASHVTVMRRLRRLKDKGVVQRVGTNRIGHWEIMRKEADTI